MRGFWVQSVSVQIVNPVPGSPSNSGGHGEKRDEGIQNWKRGFVDWRIKGTERPAGVSVGDQEGDGKKWALQ